MENNEKPIDETPPIDEKEPKPRKDSDPDPPGQFRVQLDVKSFGIGAAIGLVFASLMCRCSGPGRQCC
jgi:hypothetical protein